MNKSFLILYITATFVFTTMVVCMSRMVTQYLYSDHTFTIAFTTGVLCTGYVTVIAFYIFNCGVLEHAAKRFKDVTRRNIKGEQR